MAQCCHDTQTDRQLTGVTLTLPNTRPLVCTLHSLCVLFHCLHRAFPLCFSCVSKAFMWLALAYPTCYGSGSGSAHTSDKQAGVNGSIWATSHQASSQKNSLRLSASSCTARTAHRSSMQLHFAVVLPTMDPRCNCMLHVPGAATAAVQHGQTQQTPDRLVTKDGIRGARKVLGKHNSIGYARHPNLQGCSPTARAALQPPGQNSHCYLVAYSQPVCSCLPPLPPVLFLCLPYFLSSSLSPPFPTSPPVLPLAAPLSFPLTSITLSRMPSPPHILVSSPSMSRSM